MMRMNRTMYRKGITLLFITLVLLFGWRVSHAQRQQVILLEMDGPVTPVMANYFERGIETAVSDGAHAVLVVLDTPGGAVNTMLDIVQIFRNADVPVIVYVGPAGAQAASAGSVITAAAHAAGMAPETVIGAASPINSDGSDIGETAYRKAVEDLKATMRNLTERRGDEATALGQEMIEDARAVTAQEALDAGFIDAIATDVDDLLTQLDGATVMVNDRSVTLNTAGADLQSVSLTVVEQVLFVLANPLLIGVLLVIGVQAIIFEVTNPGGWVAGVLGLTLVALAMFGAGQLPVNWLGLGLIVLAFALFIAEAFTSGTGPLALGGTLALMAGLLVFFNSPGTPDFARISISGAVGVTAVSAAFFIFLVTKVMQSRKLQPATGSEGMVGQIAVARADFEADEHHDDYQGTVLIMGEIWRAAADEPVDRGDDVVVKSMDGFTLKVKKL